MSKLLGRELTPEEEAAKSAIVAGGSSAEGIRSVAERQPRSFFGAAAALLEAGVGTPGLRAALLSSPEFLVPLVDPERLGRDRAIGICRTLMELDDQFDIRLAQIAPKRGEQTCGLRTASILRLLDVLNEISAGARLVFMLSHLTSHPNHQIASKAALLMAHRIQNPAWVEKHILSDDARLRANVVEALWGNRDAWARRIVREALDDENNRVAGNAVMALHFLGDPGFAGLAIRMLRDERPAFRQTAAWVMGRSGEAGFLEVLRGALSDPSPDVRRSVTRALITIRRPIVKRETPPAATKAAAAETPPRPEPVERQPPPGGIEYALHLDGKHISPSAERASG